MKYFFGIVSLLIFVPICILYTLKNSSLEKSQIEFVEGVVGQPEYIHPIKGRENDVDLDLARFIFRKLVKYDRNGNIVPDLAEKWEISEDGLEYTFYLKQGVFWHDGVKFTADDVIYTLSKLQNLKDVKKEKLDDYKVRFFLTEPFAPFLDLLVEEIIPEHLGEKMQPLAPVGTGEFRVEKINYKFDFIESIELMKEKKSGNIERVKFKFFKNPHDLITAAKLGEVDSVAGLKFEWPNFHLYSHELPGRYFGLFVNLQGKELLKDAEFRGNLARSVPKQKIVDEALGGEAQSIDSPIEGSWATTDDISEYTYTPEIEKKYEGEINLTVANIPKHLKTTEILKESWEKLGLKVNVQSIELLDITEKIIKPHNFDILLLGQEVGRDPDRYTLWHSTQTEFPGLNFTSYKQVRVDKALEKGRTEFDREERKKHYALFQKILTQDIPVIYLYQPIYYYAVKNSVKGVSLEGFFSPPDRFDSLNAWTIERKIMVK